ncbi:MAG: NHL repeat-containing protein, partial [Myxococcales bacterium]|nr:NHL repeat-containing protein [Myxococcales bacterium]
TGTVSVSGVRGGAARCSPGPCTYEVQDGSEVTLAAMPATHWALDAWSLPSCLGEGTCAFTVTRSLEVTATFARVRYPLTVGVTGEGTVTAQAVALSCRAEACLPVEVESESQVVLHAEADRGSELGGWTGACAVRGDDCTVTMDGPREIQVDFAPRLAPVAVLLEGEAAADGRVSGLSGGLECPAVCSTDVREGTQVSLQASPTADTAVFTGWSAGPCMGQGATCTYTVAAEQPPSRARFVYNRLTVATAGRPGRITSDVGGVACGESCEAVLPVGTQVVLTATPEDPDTVLSAWTGDCEGAAPTCALRLDGPRAAQATFGLRPPPVANYPVADLILGQPSATADTPDNGGEGLASLDGPRGCATDGTRLWVVDGNDARVLQWNPLPTQTLMQPAGVVIGQASPTSHVLGTSQATLLDTLGGVAARPGGGLYVADRLANRILYWSAAPAAHGAPADAVIGQTTFTAALAGTSTDTFSQPAAVAFAGQRMVVADLLNHRVLIFDRAPTATGRHPAQVVLGQPGFDTRDAPEPPTAASMRNPSDVAWDPATDRLFVVDAGNQRVLGWSGLPTASRPADFVLGQLDFNASAVNAGGARGPVGLSAPRAVLVHEGSLYVSDAANGRVLVWTPVPSTTGEPAKRVLGQPDFESLILGTNAQNLESPWGLCAAGDRLYVTDNAQHRVLRFRLTPR